MCVAYSVCIYRFPFTLLHAAFCLRRLIFRDPWAPMSCLFWLDSAKGRGTGRPSVDRGWEGSYSIYLPFPFGWTAVWQELHSYMNFSTWILMYWGNIPWPWMKEPGVKHLGWASGGVLVLMVKSLSSWPRERLEGEAWQWPTPGRDRDLSGLDLVDFDSWFFFFFFCWLTKFERLEGFN